jgi:alpha-tubulin suppressor-like RCC1 family protein
MSLFFSATANKKVTGGIGLISSRLNSALQVLGSGRLWAWGNNSYGQIGTNTTGNCTVEPVSVLGAVKTFCKISAGLNFSTAIDKNGRAWGWGINGYGQLGDNTIVSKLTPVSVLGTVKTFCKISAGAETTGAIDKNGRAWGWGYNFYGQLGDNTIVSKLTPVSVLGTVKTFCEISTGWRHMVAIDKNGRAWSWGYNAQGQLGDNTIVSKRTPVSVLGTVKTFCKISTGIDYTSAIDKNGRAWGWGINGYGQLGDNTIVSKLTPVSVLGTVKTFCKISTGTYHTVAIDKNGRAWAWGKNVNGQLGDNTIVSKLTPVSVLGTVKTFCEISSGNTFSLAIDKNGKSWSWGDESISPGYGVLGNHTLPDYIKGSAKTFCKISAGGALNFSFSSGLDKNGRFWTWGDNSYGQLGDNTLVAKCTPVSVLGTVKTFCEIINSNNFGHSIAIDKNGRLWAWGSNDHGQLGDNTIVSKLTPVSVLGAVKTFCKIATGFVLFATTQGYCSAIDKNGRAWGWGYNTTGQLGDNTIVSKRTPVSVLGAVKTFCQISSGVGHTSTIDKNGRIWSWGDNAQGQLGDNNPGIISRLTPVAVAGVLKTFCKISAGAAFSVAIDKNGRAWSWGYNLYGQLGNNSSGTNINTPISVLGAVKTFCKISAGGEYHTVAIDKNGRAWSWGYNLYGQLGDNTSISRLTPVSLAGTVKTFCEISAGGQFTLAIDKYGKAWAWGCYTNTSGLYVNTYTPVQVCNI